MLIEFVDDNESNNDDDKSWFFNDDVFLSFFERIDLEFESFVFCGFENITLSGLK